MSFENMVVFTKNDNIILMSNGISDGMNHIVPQSFCWISSTVRLNPFHTKLGFIFELFF